MSEYEALDTQLRAWLDADEAEIRALPPEALRPWDASDNLIGGMQWVGVFASNHSVGGAYDIGRIRDRAVAEHIAWCDPVTMLADIAGMRALLDLVARWQHDYAEDTWYSCSQAVGEWGDGHEPGSGCADERRAGKPCDCGLDARRLTVLRCVAARYVSRPGFKEGWRLDGQG